MTDLVNLTEEQARIAADAIGKHIVDSRCTCLLGGDGLEMCDQCKVFFLDGPIDSYEKALKAEAKRFWEEHAQ